MGSTNQLELVARHSGLFKPPFLEVGSKEYGEVDRVSSLFEGQDFSGIDMLEGENVDYVIDLTVPFEEVDRILGGKRFNTIFCLSVLEHCSNPFKLAQNLTRLLKDDGILYVSVPHAWKFHGYPSDYWRFTPEGIKVLFPSIEFHTDKSWISTDILGDIRSITDHDLGRFQLKGSWFRRNGSFFRGVGADVLRLLGFLRLFQWLTRHRYLYPPVMVEMMGVKAKK